MAVLTAREFAHGVGLPVDNIENVNYLNSPVVVPGAGGLELRNQWAKPIAPAALVADRAYFVYLGHLRRRITAQQLRVFVGTGGSGAQTAEVGLFSSPLAPARNLAQTLTRLVATGSVSDLTAATSQGNSADFGLDVPANTHLWAGIRTNMATTQPQCQGLTADFNSGQILTLSTAGALTAGAGTFAGGVLAGALTWGAPDICLFYT